MKSNFTRLVLCSLLTLALVAGVTPSAWATDCNSGRFCAFDLESYVHPRLLDSGAGQGATVDVKNDDVSSAKNRTSNYWCGRNEGFFDSTIFIFAPNTNNAALGSANNKIDYFWVRSGC
jgi:hypothetical protein